MAVPTDDKTGKSSAGASPGVLASLAERQETFLARYPRKLKLGVLAGLLLLATLPLFLGHENGEEKVAPTVPADITAVAPDVPSGVGRPVLAKVINLENTEAVPETPTSSASETTAVNIQADTGVKLEAAPLHNLVQDTPDGQLPRVAEDGTEPWQAYARPFNVSDTRPRIALVITHLGMGRIATDAAITRLPPAATMVFNTDSPDLMALCNQARQKGHETLLDISMEPFDYPRSDPGTHALLTNLPNPDNIGRLLWGLRQGAGYIGITTLSGSRFTTDPDKLTPIMQELKDRGLLVMDTRIAPHSAVANLARTLHVPLVTTTLKIDGNPTPEAIDADLAQLEHIARVNGSAVGIATPLPITLDHLDVWLKNLQQRGIALAPLSAMVQ